MLGSRIGRGVGMRGQGRRRCDVDDLPKPLRDQSWHERMDRVDRAKQVDVEHPTPRGNRHLPALAGRQSAGIVDQQVDAPESVEAEFGQPFDVCRAGDVSDDAKPLVGCKFACDIAQSRLVEVGTDAGVAPPRQLQHKRAPDTRCRAGDHSDRRHWPGGHAGKVCWRSRAIVMAVSSIMSSWPPTSLRRPSSSRISRAGTP